jgi:hypothetical protein
MKASTSTALRANVVLFSVSTGIAIVPCLSVGWMFGLLDDGITELPYQGGIFAVALLIMLLLRWSARLAYESGVDAHQVQLTEEAGLEALIASDCPHGWLVQLHLELRGQRCGD